MQIITILANNKPMMARSEPWIRGTRELQFNRQAHPMVRGIRRLHPNQAKSKSHQCQTFQTVMPRCWLGPAPLSKPPLLLALWVACLQIWRRDNWTRVVRTYLQSRKRQTTRWILKINQKIWTAHAHKSHNERHQEIQPQNAIHQSIWKRPPLMPTKLEIRQTLITPS